MSSNNLKDIPEELSCISIKPAESGYSLEDQLRLKRFHLNEIAHDICTRIDGVSTLEDISSQIAQEYDIPVEQAQKDVVEFYLFLKKNKLVLTKNTLYYKYIKLYYLLLGIGGGE
jgi:hypothetical protein